MSFRVMWKWPHFALTALLILQAPWALAIPTPLSNTVSFRSPEENAFFATAMINIPHLTAESKPAGSFGTGFLVAVPREKKQPLLLLMSVAHLFQNTPNSPVLVNFHRKGSSPNSFSLTDPIQATITRGSRTFFRHPDANIDLACLNVTEAAPSIFFRNISLDQFADFNEPSLIPTREVFFLGYPQGRFDTVNSVPISRTGTIATLPRLDFNGQKEFLIDAQVFPGSSGSPVFWRTGNKIKFLGIVNAVEVDNPGARALPSSVSPLPAQPVFLGLGHVIKATVIQEFIGLAANHFD